MNANIIINDLLSLSSSSDKVIENHIRHIEEENKYFQDIRKLVEKILLGETVDVVIPSLSPLKHTFNVNSEWAKKSVFIPFEEYKAHVHLQSDEQNHDSGLGDSVGSEVHLSANICNSTSGFSNIDINPIQACKEKAFQHQNVNEIFSMKGKALGTKKSARSLDFNDCIADEKCANKMALLDINSKTDVEFRKSESVSDVKETNEEFENYTVETVTISTVTTTTYFTTQNDGIQIESKSTGNINNFPDHKNSFRNNCTVYGSTFETNTVESTSMSINENASCSSSIYNITDFFPSNACEDLGSSCNWSVASDNKNVFTTSEDYILKCSYDFENGECLDSRCIGNLDWNLGNKTNCTKVTYPTVIDYKVDEDFLHHLDRNVVNDSDYPSEKEIGISSASEFIHRLSNRINAENDILEYDKEYKLTTEPISSCILQEKNTLSNPKLNFRRKTYLVKDSNNACINTGHYSSLKNCRKEKNSLASPSDSQIGFNEIYNAANKKENLSESYDKNNFTRKFRDQFSSGPDEQTYVPIKCGSSHDYDKNEDEISLNEKLEKMKISNPNCGHSNEHLKFNNKRKPVSQSKSILKIDSDSKKKCEDLHVGISSNSGIKSNVKDRHTSCKFSTSNDVLLQFSASKQLRNRKITNMSCKLNAPHLVLPHSSESKILQLKEMMKEKKKKREARTERTKERRKYLEKQRKEKLHQSELKRQRRFERHEKVLKEKREILRKRSQNRKYYKKNNSKTGSKCSFVDSITKKNNCKTDDETNSFYEYTKNEPDFYILNDNAFYDPKLFLKQNVFLTDILQTSSDSKED